MIKKKKKQQKQQGQAFKNSFPFILTATMLFKPELLVLKTYLTQQKRVLINIQESEHYMS
jgi:hypothetical protein